MSNAASRRRTHQCCLRRLVDPHAEPQFEPIVRLIAIKDGRIKGVAHPGEHEAIIEQDLWEGVQAKLSTHGSKQRNGRAESGALLVGLLFDDRGTRMSPSHTTRKGGRYRARGQDLIAKQAVEAGRGTPADAAAFVKLEPGEASV